MKTIAFKVEDEEYKMLKAKAGSMGLKWVGVMRKGCELDEPKPVEYEHTPTATNEV